MENLEEKKLEEGGETPTPIEDGEEQGVAEIENEEEQQEEVVEPEEEKVETEKTFTQSQVNELVGKARQEGRESALRDLYGRYGVSGDEELNEIFGRGQAYDSLNDEYQTQGNSYKDVLAENALLKSRVDMARWEDIKLILNGKGLDITQENIEALIPSHPEWRNEKQTISPEMAKEYSHIDRTQPDPIAKVKIGGEAKPVAPQESEEEIVRRLYGL